MAFIYRPTTQSVLPIAGSRPVDKKAALVVSSGFRWNPTLPDRLVDSVWDAPKKCRPTPPDMMHLLGMRRGRLVATGWMGVNRNSKPVWQMRCDCGRYTVRFIRGWAKRVGVFDQCAACESTAKLSHVNRSRALHGVRHSRWLASLTEAGFTEAQIAVIDRYRLPTDDIDWLRQALANLGV